MTEHFNKLTEAEAERLAILMEEMAESCQIIGKILRHGFESCNPFDESSMPNRILLEKELGHVRFAMINCCNHGDVSKQHIHNFAEQKSISITQWLHHQS